MLYVAFWTLKSLTTKDKGVAPVPSNFPKAVRHLQRERNDEMGPLCTCGIHVTSPERSMEREGRSEKKVGLSICSSGLQLKKKNKVFRFPLSIECLSNE
ncbi:hypothetical protein VNO77_01909 [Canavalia gladiata]|uniref:Uncharacterized protein n=1 Tax=Canavalia gladiata TaxID=3824 RepID=A0AAN9MS32_CANGL